MDNETLSDILFEALENGSLNYIRKPVYRKTYTKARVVTFENPSFFNVKIEEPGDATETTLDAELQYFIQNLEASLPVTSTRIGMPVMAPHPTIVSEYARGEIVTVDGHGRGNVVVNLIDIGMLMNVDIESLRMITKNLLRIPKTLYLCRMHNIVPLSGDKWPEMDWIRCLNGQEVKISFINEDKFGIFDVQMELNGRSFGINLILDLGVAKAVDLAVVQTPSSPYPVYDYSAWEHTKVPVFGVSVVSMEVAWFQLQTDSANAIIDATSDYIASTTQAQLTAPFSKNIGDPCLALYTEDSLWYRGQILEIREPRSYKVLFVDFGNVELVSDNQLTRIPDELVNFPAAATEVSIIDIIGIQGKSELAKFKELVESKDLVATIEDPHSNIGDKERVLISVWQEDGKSLSDYFTRPKALYRETTPLSYDIAEGSFCNIMIGGPSEFYPGVEYPGVVSYAESERSVWLQLSDSEERAIAMGPELQQFYSNSELRLHTSLIRKDMYCVAKQSSDSQWYRAIIKEVFGSTVNVLYIDYGNDEEVGIDSLRPIINYFAREKSLSIQTALNVSMKPEVDEDKIVNGILDFTEGKKLYVTLYHEHALNYASIKVDLCDMLLSMGLVDKANSAPLPCMPTMPTMTTTIF